MMTMGEVMQDGYQGYGIRDWQGGDRPSVVQLIADVLGEYGLDFDPLGADRDVVEVEQFYRGGEFWVVEAPLAHGLGPKVVGTAAYYPVARGVRAVEIRKMYLRPEVRGKGLGRYLLGSLERAIAQRQFQMIWIETASVLQAAVQLYESHGYERTTGVETPRCDRIYVKYIHPLQG